MPVNLETADEHSAGGPLVNTQHPTNKVPCRFTWLSTQGLQRAVELCKIGEAGQVYLNRIQQWQCQEFDFRKSGFPRHIFSRLNAAGSQFLRTTFRIQQQVAWKSVTAKSCRRQCPNTMPFAFWSLGLVRRMHYISLSRYNRQVVAVSANGASRDACFIGCRLRFERRRGPVAGYSGEKLRFVIDQVSLSIEVSTSGTTRIFCARRSLRLRGARHGEW